MSIRIAQFLRPRHDVVDEAFLAEFPDVEVVKADTVEEFAAALEGAEALYTYNSAITPEAARVMADHGKGLKWVQFATVGIDIAEESGMPGGFWITNIGDLRQKALAGHAMALMLAVMRGVHRYQPYRARHDWARDEMLPLLLDPEGLRMVICGMGRIGQDVARKAKAFDMEVVAVTRAPRPAVPEIDRVVPRERMDEVLPGADVLMITMPLDDDTEGFITAQRIGLLKETAIVVNVSRGLVVDEAALARALKEGRLKGAGLDAFGEEPLAAESPFWDLPNVVMTPHVGAQGGADQLGRLRDLVRDNTRRYLSGKPLRNVVRTPDGAPPYE